jgi:hypothetical protein
MTREDAYILVRLGIKIKHKTFKPNEYFQYVDFELRNQDGEDVNSIFFGTAKYIDNWSVE